MNQIDTIYRNTSTILLVQLSNNFTKITARIVRAVASPFFLWVCVPLLIIIVSGAFQSVIPQFKDVTLIQYPYTKNVFTHFQSTALLSGDRVTGSFQSRANRLGILEVRFHTFGKINDDQVIFRIKEKDQENWISQTTHKVDQFQPDDFFPFGFSPQNDSEGKIYYFEIESVSGIATQSVAISNIEPVLKTKHKYTKQSIEEDPIILFEILQKSFGDILFILVSNIVKYSVLVPLSTYLFILLIFRKKLNEAVISNVHTYVHFSRISSTFHEIRLIIQKKIKNAWKQCATKVPTFFEVDGKRVFPELDGLRAWAVITVISTHMGLHFNTLLSQSGTQMHQQIVYAFRHFPMIGAYGGALGVNLFFILSSFLIYGSLYKRASISVLDFMNKRYKRLLPAHVVVLIPLLAKSSLFAIFLNIFFLVELFAHVVNANILTWTMTYEIVFYLLCALWLKYRSSYSVLSHWLFIPGLAIFLLLSQTTIQAFLSDHAWKYFDMDYFLSFFFGIVLAQLYFEKQMIWEKIEPYLVHFSYLGFLFIIFYRFIWYDVIFLKTYGVWGVHMTMLILNLSLFSIVASMLTSHEHITKKFFRYAKLRYIGIVSYSMYLCHMAFGIPIASRIIQDIPSLTLKILLLYPVSVLVSFLIGSLLFHYLEKPYFLSRSRSKK